MKDIYRDPRVRGGLALGAVLVIGGGALAMCGNDTEPGPGYDVSHPQCSSEDPSQSIDLPDARSFAIVGFNRGVAKTANPCFADQMEWAMDSAGDKDMPKAAIYVNSGNPGAALAQEWPKSGEFDGQPCAGEDSIACAYVYGQELAEWNLREFDDNFGKDHDEQAIDFTWWIDVEAGNSWQCNQGISALCGQENAVPVESGALSRNAAVITGMAEKFQAEGIRTGIYTVPAQWNLIVENAVENVPEFEAARGLDVWVAGAVDEQEALEACSQPPFGGLGRVVLSQYNPDITRVLDKNVVCEDEK